MFSTLQAALGTWPSDNSFDADSDVRPTGHSTVNEGFDFTDEQQDQSLHTSEVMISEVDRHSSPSITKLYPSLASNNNPSVPPFLVARGAEEVAVASVNTDRWTFSVSGFERQRSTRDTEAGKNSNTPVDVRFHEYEDERTAHAMELDSPSRTPSPFALGGDFDQELASLWSNDSRKAFHDMVTADGYVNRYRMHMKKRQRLTHYLEHPDLDPVLCDGTKDHQTKYQAVNWKIIDGKLFRKPEVGRVGKLRRHLDEIEAWDILTREHLRSGHLGRDKFRKRLEQRYIGYTLKEIMFVLKECRRCGGREKVATNFGDSAVLPKPTTKDDPIQHDLVGAQSTYLRGQTSNMMLP